jgi:hypothetical protein
MVVGSMLYVGHAAAYAAVRLSMVCSRKPEFKTFYFLFFCSRTSSHKYTHRSAHGARGFDVKVDCLGSLGLFALEQGFT